MAKGDKEDIRNAKRTAAAKAKGGQRHSPSQIKAWNKAAKESAKAGTGPKVRATSSSSVYGNSKYGNFNATNSISARMPSVASKANAKNKMKAQGGKIGLSPTSSALERARARKGSK